MIVCAGPMFVDCKSRLMILEGIKTINSDDDHDDQIDRSYLRGIPEEELWVLVTTVAFVSDAKKFEVSWEARALMSIEETLMSGPTRRETRNDESSKTDGRTSHDPTDLGWGWLTEETVDRSLSRCCHLEHRSSFPTHACCLEQCFSYMRWIRMEILLVGNVVRAVLIHIESIRNRIHGNMIRCRR